MTNFINNNCWYIKKYFYPISIDDIITFIEMIIRDDTIEFYQFPKITKSKVFRSVQRSPFGQSIQDGLEGTHLKEHKLRLRLNLLNQKWKHCRCIFNSPAARSSQESRWISPLRIPQTDTP